MRDRVFLSGFMAAGKSAVGAALAQRLGCPFRDLDLVVEQRTGRSVAELFASLGEGGFRELESEALREVCRLESVVVALGGGAVIRAENRAMMRRRGHLVWLNTPRSTILPRLERGGVMRPLFEDREQALQLLDNRIEFYRDCDLEIRPRAGENPTDLASRIVKSLQ